MSFPPLSPLIFSIEGSSPLQDAQEPDDVLDFDDGETIASSWLDAGEIQQRAETPQPGAFRFKGRYCVLTYSQVPPAFRPLDISELLCRDRAKFIICREPHRDGGTHYHVFVDYRRVRDLTGARRWDVQECIRIFSEYEGLHGALTPTLRNTQMLSETLSTTEIDRSLQREILMLTEWANDVGRQSQMLQTKTAFLRSAKKWIRELWSQLSAMYPDTPIGNIRIFEDPMTPPREYASTWGDIPNSESTFEIGCNKRVGESCTSGTSTHGPSSVGSDPKGPCGRAGPRVRPVSIDSLADW